MSRGAGRIERAIEVNLDKHPDKAFTTEELCRLVYGVEAVEKKHRVAVIRAANKLMERRDTLHCYRGEGLGGTAIYFTVTNVISYAMARLKADNPSPHDARLPEHWIRTEAQLRRQLSPGGDRYERVIEGGAWWQHTQSAIAEIEARRAGDKKRLKKVLAEREEANAAVRRLLRMHA